MKNSKIITTIATLNLVLFMSVSSFAKPFTTYEGDIIKAGVKKQIEAVKSTITEIATANEFSHLRFDVNKFNTETEVVELPLNSMDYLSFDASDFNNTSDLSEMPVSDFGYIRFDVNNYNNASEISEMPVNEFDYLRFDVNKYSNEDSVTIDELPVN